MARSRAILGLVHWLIPRIVARMAKTHRRRLDAATVDLAQGIKIMRRWSAATGGKVRHKRARCAPPRPPTSSSPPLPCA